MFVFRNRGQPLGVLGVWAYLRLLEWASMGERSLEIPLL
jgi:hypothetical protein